MPSNELLQQSLDDAFRAHFAKLFAVLLGEPNDVQFGRFVRGYNNSVQMYERIEKEVLKKDVVL